MGWFDLKERRSRPVGSSSSQLSLNKLIASPIGVSCPSPNGAGEVFGRNSWVAEGIEKRLMSNSLVIGIGVLGIIALVKWLVYTGLLWVMIKIQKLNYNVPGLFASSLLATLVGFLPFVGAYVSWAVLVICLWKCTGADIFPDVAFTVAIAGALMFCLHLWAFGALTPGPEEMRHAFDKARAEEAEGGFPAASGQTDETDSDSKPVIGSVANSARPVATETKASGLKPGMTVSARTVDDKSSPLRPQISTNAVVLKGISPYTARPTVIVSVGGQVKTLMVGDSFSGSTPQGRIHLRCEQITPTNVVFSLEDGSRFVLHVD